MNSITAVRTERAVRAQQQPESSAQCDTPTPPTDFEVIYPTDGLIYLTTTSVAQAQRYANRRTMQQPGSAAWYVRQGGEVVHVGDPAGDTRTEMEVRAELKAREPKPPMWDNPLRAEHVRKRRSIRKPVKRNIGRSVLFFEGPSRRKGSDNDQRAWDLPCTGGYLGGRATGEAAALEYFKALRENTAAGTHHLSLGSIVESMMCRFQALDGRRHVNEYDEEKHPAEYTAFQGQVSGFCQALDQWLTQLAAHSGAGDMLAKYPSEVILERATAGLSFDERAYYEAMSARRAAAMAAAQVEEGGAS